MIRLEHINLVVKNLDKTQDFILTAFPDWRVRGSGSNEWYGKMREWRHIGTDDTYISINQGNTDQNRDLKSHAPGLAHIGFNVDDVDGISKRLQDKGYEVATIGADHPYRKTMYYIDPAGFEFEFIQYMSEKPDEKNMYGGETSSITRVSAAEN